MDVVLTGQCAISIVVDEEQLRRLLLEVNATGSRAGVPKRPALPEGIRPSLSPSLTRILRAVYEATPDALPRTPLQVALHAGKYRRTIDEACRKLGRLELLTLYSGPAYLVSPLGLAWLQSRRMA